MEVPHLRGFVPPVPCDHSVTHKVASMPPPQVLPSNDTEEAFLARGFLLPDALSATVTAVKGGEDVVITVEYDQQCWSEHVDVECKQDQITEQLPATPDGFFAALRSGDRVQVFKPSGWRTTSGWYEATVKERLADDRIQVGTTPPLPCILPRATQS